MENKNIIVGVSGASGAVYTLRFCSLLQSLNYNPIVVVTNSAEIVAKIESGCSFFYFLRKLGIKHYQQDDIGAPIASGSFLSLGMVVYPCSITSLSKIAYSNDENLLTRVADVMLKERRKLILVVRETPLHGGHLDLMRRVFTNGGVVMPLIFSFYNNKKNVTLSIEDYFDQFNGRILDQFGIGNNVVKRWCGGS